MTLYDEIKAKHGDGPKWASRSDHTSYYGYAGGKTLGTFDTVQAAKDAGAVSTEKVFDEAAFKAAQAAHTAHQNMITSEWCDEMKNDSGLSDEVFALVYAMAYERAHSAGYNEVELYVDVYTDFATSIIKASAKADA